MPLRRTGYIVCLTLCMSCLVGAQRIGMAEGPAVAHAPGPLRLPGITLPAREITVGTVQRGIIESLHVREGDRVSVGDPLFSLHSAVQRASVTLARARADSTAEVDLARTRCRDAQRRFDRVKALRAEGSAPQDEFEEAATALAETVIEVKLAEFELQQARRQLVYEEARLAERAGRCPINGYVVEVMKRQGEAVDETEPILRVVRIDPLHVQVDCPIDWAGRLEPGDEAQVAAKSLAGQPRRAKVIAMSKAGDAASDTFRIKLEVPNPQHDWIAGMKVGVRFREAKISRGGDGAVPVSTEKRL